MSNALQIYTRANELVPFIETMKESVAALVGCELRQAPAVIMSCMCDNITFMDFGRTYHLIDGKPTMQAAAMRAMFKTKHGGDTEFTELSPDKVTLVLTDSKGRVKEFSLTWEQALQERWPWRKNCGPGTAKTEPSLETIKDNWSTPLGRQAMMAARVTSMGMRVVCEELAYGIYVPEEVYDLRDDAVAVTATPVSEKTALEIARERLQATDRGDAGEGTRTSDAGRHTGDAGESVTTATATVTAVAGEPLPDSVDVDIEDAEIEFDPAKLEAQQHAGGANAAERAMQPITKRQMQVIAEQASLLQLTDAQMTTILSNPTRNVKVLAELKRGQATELIEKFNQLMADRGLGARFDDDNAEIPF